MGIPVQAPPEPQAQPEQAQPDPTPVSQPGAPDGVAGATDVYVDVREREFNFSRKLPDGDLLTIRSDSLEGFVRNMQGILGEANTIPILQKFQWVAAVPAQPAQQNVPNGQHPASVPAQQTVPQGQGGQAPVVGPICPECGVGQVVPKKRTNGTGSFMGCNNYPNCKYIQR